MQRLHCFTNKQSNDINNGQPARLNYFVDLYNDAIDLATLEAHVTISSERFRLDRIHKGSNLLTTWPDPDLLQRPCDDGNSKSKSTRSFNINLKYEKD